MNTAVKFRYGFRVVGGRHCERRLIDWAAAFAGYAACDERAECQREAYLSAFHFAEGFRDHLRETGSPKGFSGPCWADWLWFDIDRPDPRAATDAARRLAQAIIERYGVVDDDLLTFYSGEKGFHIALSTALWRPEPGPAFHQTTRHFAEGLAAVVGVEIDTGVYDKVRLFRAPNSRHQRSGRYKRRITVDELMGLSPSAIVELAAEPTQFDIPTPTHLSEQAAADWQRAMDDVANVTEAAKRRRAGCNGKARLNRMTLTFMRDGAPAGSRHRLLFSAAANLAEFNCPPALAHQLLTEAALDCGLPPADVRHAIDCGLKHKVSET